MDFPIPDSIKPTMITASTRQRQPPRWQQLMAKSITRPIDLLQRLQLPLTLLPAAEAAAALFPLRVPPPYLQRIRPGDINDPLLRQVLPLGAEQASPPGFSTDPVGDLDAEVSPGLLHKYHGRILMITTGACAVHCRYCFRRHFPYGGEHTGRRAWSEALTVIRGDSSISEIILSGGDPLSLADTRLAELVEQLQAIPHLKRLRLHTRTPVVLPQRVDGELCHWIAATSLKVVVVIHANHAQELGAEVNDALRRLANTGATLLNQSVLLRGVNDNAKTLTELSNTLFDTGVLPYYLHLLDPVIGASHFTVDRHTATKLHRQMAAQLPGYLLPRLVFEAPGAANKLAVELPAIVSPPGQPL